MDIWQKMFLYGGAALGAVMLMVALMVLGTAQNGVLSIEGLQQMSAPMQSFYAVFKWFVYLWLISGAVMLFRLIRGLFSR